MNAPTRLVLDTRHGSQLRVDVEHAFVWPFGRRLDHRRFHLCHHSVHVLHETTRVPDSRTEKHGPRLAECDLDVTHLGAEGKLDRPLSKKWTSIET
jgi:hypothetical protein